MPYYRSPSVSSSMSGGYAQSPAQRARRARQSPEFNAWRASVKRAADELQNRAATKVGAKTRSVGKGQRRYAVDREALYDLARQYYRQAGYEPKSQGADTRARRVHGLSKKELHRPVTRAEAIQLFLEGYRRQATEGHVKTRGKNKGQTAKLGNPVAALRSRLTRTAGTTPKQGKVHGRRVIKACPEEAVSPKTGRISPQAAKKYDCEDSWKLRRRGGWKNYQVPGVSHHSDRSSARKSPLYKRAKKQLPKGTRRTVSPTWLQPYQRRKGQSPMAHRSRVKAMKGPGRGRLVVRQSPAQSPSQASDFDVSDLFASDL